MQVKNNRLPEQISSRQCEKKTTSDWVVLHDLLDMASVAFEFYLFQRQ